MAHGSLESKPTELLSRRDLLILTLAVMAGCAIYLLAAARTYAIGFPLDDSWIHQTYARNLAERGEWAFRPGLRSAGSTAPLWSALLALGFLIHLAPYFWTYLLGGLALLGLVLTFECGSRWLLSAYRPTMPWFGLFFAFEWHLLWAAMSGMETILHAFVVALVLMLLMANTRRFLVLGVLTGLSIWLRPDGLTLVGPVVMTVLLSKDGARSRWQALARYFLGAGSIFVVYLLFNLVIGGAPLPNTFYAKQAEYQAWQARPITDRFGQMLLQLLTGPAFLLLPGVVGFLMASARRRDWGILAAAAWCLAFMGMYVLRLPVYQHGRYLMPAMPVFFLIGLAGVSDFRKSNFFGRHHWVVNTAWQAGLALLWASFIYLGARSYAQDVAVIESEMVSTAKWSAEHLPADALIAAHDIGALGYFDGHPLLDLAGLVSPEVVPFIRDEQRLAIYLEARGAQYLIAFPEFYPRLTKDLDVVYVTRAPFSATYGHDNMTVFRWHASNGLE